MKNFAVYLLLITILMCGVIICFGQDTTKAPKDTTYVPAFEKLDTAKTNFICVKTKGYNQPLVYVEQGYIILKGFAVKKNGNWEWVDTPKIIAALDNRKQKVYKLIQIIQ